MLCGSVDYVSIFLKSTLVRNGKWVSSAGYYNNISLFPFINIWLNLPISQWHVALICRGAATYDVSNWYFSGWDSIRRHLPLTNKSLTHDLLIVLVVVGLSDHLTASCSLLSKCSVCLCWTLEAFETVDEEGLLWLQRCGCSPVVCDGLSLNALVSKRRRSHVTEWV